MTKRAENVSGLKLSTEDTDFSASGGEMVEEHFLRCEASLQDGVERKEERMLG